MSSIGTYTLRAEFMTLDGHVTATYVDFQSAFAIDPSTNDLDLANTSPSWTEGSIRFKTRITERHVLVVNYHSSPTLTIERRLYLLPLLSVSGTTLYFQNWSSSIRLSASCHHFQATEFWAWCLKKNGTLKWSHVDLNDHIGVEDDGFKLGGSGFASRVSGLKIEKKEGSLLMYAMIKQSNGVWYEPEKQINLSLTMLNKDGELVWEPSDGVFDRNGICARFLEDVPLVGYVVMCLHFNAGNKEHGKAAAIKATKRTLMLAYSSVIGMALGPVASILLTAAITTQVMILEKRVADAVLTNDDALDRFQKITMARVVTDGLAEMAGSAGSELTKTWVSKMSRPFLEKMTSNLLREVGEFGVDKTAETVGENFMSQLTIITAGEAIPEDWKKAEIPIYPKVTERQCEN